MKAPVVLAQLSGSLTQTGAPPSSPRLEKPLNGQAVTLHPDGQTQFNFSDVASEKLVFVRVGERLVVLFDNQSTVTIDRVFDSSGHPAANVTFEMGPDRVLNGDQFAGLFPITTDPSVLPGAGGRTAHAHFGGPTVDQLSTFTPLALLGAETFGVSFNTPNQQTPNATPNATLVAGVADVANIAEDSLAGGNAGFPGHAAGPTTVTGSLHVSFGANATGRSFAFAADQASLTGLTSDALPVHLFVTTSGGLPLMIGYVGTDPTIAANQVFTVSLDANSTPEGTYTFTLLRPLDHPIQGTDDTLNLSVNVIASDSSGIPANTSIHVNVVDDTPIVVAANETHSTLTDPQPHSFTFTSQTGSLGISWGADRFNDHADGGVSNIDGHTGDRAVVFVDATVTATGHAGDSTTADIATLTSFGQTVHYALLDNGTVLLAYTGTTVPALPGTGTGSGDDGPHVSPNVVFVVSLSDASDSGGYVITQYQPLDHNTGAQTFDTIDLAFRFTATDSDGDGVSGTLTATVNDTVPVVTGPISDETVAESTVSGPVPELIPLFERPLVKGDDNSFVPATTGRSLNINWNADDNNVVNGVGSHDRGVTFTTTAAPDGLTSNGVQLVYTESADGTLLTATAGASGPTVFMVQLYDSGTGNYIFTLLDNLDHAAGNGADNLPLTFSFTATDSDGDTTAPASFTVNVTDDTPTVTQGNVSTNVATTDPLDGTSSSGTGASLGINWGADDGNSGAANRSATFTDATVSAKGDGTTVITTLHSDGQDVHYVLLNGNTQLVAFTGTTQPTTVPDNATDAASAHVVFVATVSDADNDGGYSIVQYQPLDHDQGTTLFSTITLGFNFTATDADGDTATGTFTTTVNDTGPSVGHSTPATVSEDGPMSVTGAPLVIDFGADSGSFAGSARALAFTNAVVTATDPDNTAVALTSYGQAVSAVLIGGVLVGYTGTTAPTALTDASVVFTAALSSAGTYDFVLKQPLDHAAPVGGSDYLNLSFNITATDADGDQGTGKFVVDIDAAGSIGSIDYTGETTGVFVNLGGTDASFGGQTVHGHSATDLTSGGGHIIGIDALGSITDASGGSADDVIVGSGGVSTIHGNGGNDTIIYNVGATGTETVDGGTGTDTQIVNGSGSAVTYNVNPITDGADTDIGINIVAGVTVASTIAADAGNYEVATKAVEEIQINLGSAGDHVVVSGDLSGTGLASSTITINGGAGDDTVDLSKFTAKEDVVFDGAGNGSGGDTVILGFASNAAGVSYSPILDDNGHLIGTTITIQGPNGPMTDTFTHVEHFQFTDGTLSVGQIFPPTATPVVDAVADTAATDAGRLLASGNAITDVGDSDIDAGTTLSVTAVNGLAAGVGSDVAGTYGTLHLNANGSYSYTAGPALDALQVGQNPSDVFHFTVTDSNGGSTTTTLMVNVTGANDTAVIFGTTTGLVVEAGGVNNTTANTPSASGTLTDTDADNPPNTFRIVGTAASDNHYGTYTVDASGHWTYNLDNSNATVQGLNVGGQLTDSFTVRTADGTAQAISITINGSNDAAVLSGTATGSVIEAGGANNIISGTPGASGTLTDSDVDNAANTFQAVTTLTASTGGYGTYTVDASGHWTYNLDNGNATVQALAGGQPLTDTFAVKTQDGTSQTVTIQITGANDAASFGGADTGAVTEAGGVNNASPGTPTAGGTLIVSDVDSSNAVTAENNIATSYGHFTINAGGVWSYTLDNGNTAVQALNTTSTALQDVMTVTTADGTTHQITVTITGADDAAVNTVPTSQTVSNAATLTFSSANSDAISVADVDNTTLTETLTVSHGTLTLHGISGLSFTAGDGTADQTMTFSGSQSAINTALNGLVYTPTSGYAGADSLQIGSTDGALNTASSVAITVTQSNHAPLITSGTQSGSVTEDATVGGFPQLVSNGGFETGNLSGWTFVGGSGAFGQVDIVFPNNNSTYDFSVSGKNTSTLTQLIQTTAGAHYTLDFFIAAAANSGTDSFNAFWNGANVATISNTPTSGTPYIEYTLDVVGTGGTSTLQFAFADKNMFWVLDDVSVKPVVAVPAGETTSGQITFTDADAADTHAITVTPGGSGYYGTFTPVLGHDTTGSGTGGIVNWTFSVNDSDIQSLAANQHVVQTYTINIDDHHGGVTPQTVSITLNGANDAPTLANPIADQSATPNTAFSFHVPTNTFNDVDATDVLTYTATQVGGGALPAWLQFNALTDTFSGTPGITDGPVSITVTATDGSNTSVSDTFAINLPIPDHAPINSVPGAQTVGLNSSLIFSTTNGDAISVSDVDNGTLTLTLSASHGALTLHQLSGLSFLGGDGSSDTSMTFTGTVGAINAALDGLTYAPSSGYSGSDAMQIVTSDGTLSDTDSVGITVQAAPANHAPVITSAAPTATIVEDASYYAPSSSGNMLLNGDFDYYNGSFYTLQAWTVAGSVNVYGGYNSGGSAGFGSSSSISQSIATVAGTTYSIDFFALYGGDVTVSENGVSVGSFSQFTNDWTEHTFQFVATSANTVIQISTDSVGYLDVDQIAVQPVSSVTPGKEASSGTITFTDADLADTHTVAQAAPSFALTGGTLTQTQINALTSAGSLTLTEHDSNGSGSGSVDWSYQISDSAIQFLTNGQTLTETYAVTITDNHNAATSQNVTFTINGSAPAVISEAITSASGVRNHTLNAGDVVTVTVNMNETVNVTGTPQLNLAIGSSTVQANYASGSGSSSLVFTYTIQSGQADANGISIGSLNLANGGTITDLGGRAAVLTASAADDVNYMVDTTAPTVSGSTGSSSHTHSGSTYTETATFTVTFSEAVTGVSKSAFSATDSTGSWSVSNVALVSGSTYTVTATGTGGSTIVGTALTLGLKANSAIIDSAGNTASANSNIAKFSSLAPAGTSGEAINLALIDHSDHTGMVSLNIAGLPAGWVLSEGTHNADGSWSVLTSDVDSLTVTSPEGYVGALVANVSESWINADGTVGNGFVADNVEAYAKGAPVFAWSGDDTLTASRDNDTLVFANKIGTDVVHNFDTAHDRIDLIGFAGVSNFAAVRAHLANDADGNAKITLGDGETITLIGVDAAALNAGDFVFDQTPVTHNAGTMAISDGALLPISGVVDNSGAIEIGSAGGKTDLEIVQHGATLQGGGTLTLSDSSENGIFGSDPSVTLTNVDNTISGAGELGDGQMTLVNEGSIIATGSNALVVDTGGNTIVNTGTLEATGSGGLVVHSDVANNGTLWANGGTVTLDGDVSGAGSARMSGNAGLEIGGAFNQQVLFDDGAGGTLKLDHPDAFGGIVAGFGDHDVIDLAGILGARASLSYVENAQGTGGVLSVTDGAHTANIAFSGQHTTADFHIAADSSGSVNHALIQLEHQAQQLAAAA